MAAMHTSPHEAMEMQKSLHIKQCLGIHYGTFPLAGDLQDEPIEDLSRAREMPEYTGQKFEIGPSGTFWEW
jgi:L-ascorbate metabolism protein UlaG (beta-lactamase superfamily)